jgi:hypothetical protein
MLLAVGVQEAREPPNAANEKPLSSILSRRGQLTGSVDR